MKYLLLTVIFCLWGCTSRDVAEILLEHETSIQLGDDASHCYQISKQCYTQPGEIAGANGHYFEWKNEDGTTGCSCDKS